MKILHTADIHLRTTGDSRWQALQRLVRLGEERSVSLLAICGDLFDRRIDVHRLKSPLRELFQGCGFSVVILPGNHDARALSEGDFLGDNVTVIGRSSDFIDLAGARLFALPFERIEGEKILERLLWMRQHTRSDGANILLYHGELVDMVYARDGFGDEDPAGYMPVRISYFDGMGFDYVLAGHFHCNFEVRQYADGYFVYAGSPVSVTRKETGVRKANLFEVGRPPMPVELDTSYFEDVVVTLDPRSQDDPVTLIRDRLRSCSKNARVLLNVSGFVDLEALGKNETDLAKEIGALMTPEIEKIDQRWNDVGAVLHNDLYARCLEKLDARDMAAGQQDRVRELILEGMMEVMNAD